MPKWGLSQELASVRPWGLEPDLLAPAKTNTDPIHEEIYLNELERLIVDSPSYQRLRRVRQLGTTHLVYPGATHTRFQHSLGTLRAAQNLLDHVFDNPLSSELQDDLVSEWRREEKNVGLAIAEATVLARLGALLHDFCHVPFGHTLEDDFNLLTSHDGNRARFDVLWSQIDPRARAAISNELMSELLALILRKAPDQPVSKYPFVADLVGNTICADLLDYLWRDFYFLGLPGRLGQRFLSYFYITNSTEEPAMRYRMALRIEKKGRLRADVVSEVFKYLRYRYELGERALQHHAKIAADAMVAKAFELWIKSAGVDQVEQALRTQGDDSVLETIAVSGPPGAANLARAVLDRRLYAQQKIASQDRAFTARHGIYEAWTAPGFRQKLEVELARVVGLAEPEKVIVWVPDPRMRLKAADVLVSWGGVVGTLREWDSNHGRRAQEIYESHERLWAVQLFADRQLTQTQKERAAAFVSQELRIQWDPQPKHESIPPMIVQVLRELSADRHVTESQQLELAQSANRTTKGVDPTFDDLLNQAKRQHDAQVKADKGGSKGSKKPTPDTLPLEDSAR